MGGNGSVVIPGSGSGPDSENRGTQNLWRKSDGALQWGVLRADDTRMRPHSSQDTGKAGPHPHAPTSGQKPGAVSPDGDSADQGAQRMAELVHELSGLLDGSMRTVNLAIASRAGGGEAPEVARETDEMARRLRTVRTALEQMAGMLQAASRPESMKAPGPRRRLGLERLTLHDAVVNGVAILEPLAAEHGVLMQARVEASVRDLAAGPVYTVVVNGVRNAIESLARRREEPGGGGGASEKRVEIEVRLEPVMDGAGALHSGHTPLGHTAGCSGHVVVLIRDNGIGPPMPDRTRPGRPGTPGFTTKAGGSGLGLAVCRDVLSRHGGMLSLEGNGRGGATLVARYPYRGTGANGMGSTGGDAR